MPKGTSQDEVTSNSEKTKPVALVVIKLRLSEGIRQAVSQSVEIPSNIHFKFCSHVLEAFRVVLKAFLSLVIPAKVPGWYCGAGFR